jgi:hypothetical protein
MENKLKTAKQEMSQIINSKVFSRGNNLIYELDRTSRQLRLIKDHVFLQEKRLTEEVKLGFERELEETRAQLADLRA